MARAGCLGVRSKTTGVGFVKQVGFKTGVKETGSYGCADCRVVKQIRKK